MRTQAKWLRSATMMAFLAVVALFVSPVLALACCCHDAPPVAVHANVHSCCADEAQVVAPDHHAEQAPQCVSASVRDNCDCATLTADSTFVASDNARCFAPLAVALPAKTSLIAFVADARRAQYAHFAARPRLPDRRLNSGRAPPALAAS